MYICIYNAACIPAVMVIIWCSCHAAIIVLDLLYLYICCLLLYPTFVSAPDQLALDLLYITLFVDTSSKVNTCYTRGAARSGSKPI